MVRVEARLQSSAVTRYAKLDLALCSGERELPRLLHEADRVLLHGDMSVHLWNRRADPSGDCAGFVAAARVSNACGESWRHSRSCQLAQ